MTSDGGRIGFGGAASVASIAAMVLSWPIVGMAAA
jgi:hypothetical protein